MGRHGGGAAREPRTDQGKPFEQMSGQEKAKEFDNSVADPKGYASRNFSNENRSSGEGKHRR